MLGTIGARTGFTRNNYSITPGLYCIGEPDNNAPVLVTANYKLTFDALRRELTGETLWLLVVDTRGINVWCAAGKKTFSAEEVAFQVKIAKLDQLVSHRQLILPQLAASGVAVRKLKKLCGFSGRFGPIRAAALPAFLRTGRTDETMRTVTFSLRERAVLIPLEICMLWKKLLFALVLFCLLSGISPEIYSLTAALSRATILLCATLTAILSGAALTPLLLPWIPFRQFWLKGTVTGGLVALLFLYAGQPAANGPEQLALGLWITGCSAFLAMNFTGSTPFTSLSGVEKEMRRGLPVQIGAVALALVCWLAGPFI
jgi:CO dehydrogenase/acetyl-CoA synthase delta subunit